MLRAMDRFWSKTRKGKGGCVVWVAFTHPVWGYGRFALNGKVEQAHRVAFTLAHGREPVRDLHHTCRNPACVSPAHLVEVTPREHGATRKNLKTACKRGHDLTDSENVRVYRDIRFCRACDRERNRLRRST